MWAQAGMQLGGAALQAYGSYKAGKAKKKAAKARMRMLQQGLNQFKTGSKDAYGNKLSADSKGLWNYDLSDAGKAAKKASTNAIHKMNLTSDKTAAELSRNAMMGKHLANTMTARANQAAAMRSGARTNSNLGSVANSFGQAGSQRLRDNYMQGLQAGYNAVDYNTNMRQNLANVANTASQPIQTMQGNLQNMVNNLNKSVMGQYNTMAGAAADPYMHGMHMADMWKGLGSGLQGHAQNNQQQKNYQDYLSTLRAIYGAK